MCSRLQSIRHAHHLVQVHDSAQVHTGQEEDHQRVRDHRQRRGRHRSGHGQRLDGERRSQARQAARLAAFALHRPMRGPHTLPQLLRRVLLHQGVRRKAARRLRRQRTPHHQARLQAHRPQGRVRQGGGQPQQSQCHQGLHQRPAQPARLQGSGQEEEQVRGRVPTGHVQLSARARRAARVDARAAHGARRGQSGGRRRAQQESRRHHASHTRLVSVQGPVSTGEEEKVALLPPLSVVQNFRGAARQGNLVIPSVQ